MTRAQAAGASFAGLLALAAVGAFLLWRSLLTLSNDPGPVDFATLIRQKSGGDALICTRSLCPLAPADMTPPIFTSSAAAVVTKLRLYASRSAFIDEIRVAGHPDRLRFIQRRAAFGTPAFVDIWVAPESSGASTVAMYARSNGRPDHAGRLRQLQSWLAAIAGDRED